MTVSSKLTSKFQLTLPKEVREALGAGAGYRIVFTPIDGTTWKVQAIPEKLTDALKLAKAQLKPADFRDLHADFEDSEVDDHR